MHNISGKYGITYRYTYSFVSMEPYDRIGDVERVTVGSKLKIEKNIEPQSEIFDAACSRPHQSTQDLRMKCVRATERMNN